jgi:hypothetical protein
MRGVFHRRSARKSGAIAAAILLCAGAACFNGQSTNEQAPTGVIGPTGGGGTSGGGGTLYAGTYSLQDVDDSTLPFQLAYDSAVGGDTSRVFQAWIDSSTIYLNNDSSAEEMDYLTIRDVRTATDSSFNREISFGDTLAGTFSSTESAITVDLTDTVSGEVNVTYTVSGSTFSGSVPYDLYNTDNQLAASGTASYEFVFVGPPPDAAVVMSPATRSAVIRRGLGPSSAAGRSSAITGAAAGSRVRRWRVPAWALRELRSAPVRTRP